MTTPIFHIDEGPFQVNIEIALPAALASMGAAIDAAKRNNSPYGIVFTTTAGKKDDKDGKYFYSLIQESAIWTERFYDAKDETDLRALVMRNSRSSRTNAMPSDKDNSRFKGVYQVYAVFSHRQLGKTDEWLLEQLVRTKARGDDANRDYFNVWTAGTQSSPLPTDIIERLAHSVVESDFQSRSKVGDYMLRWYVPEYEIAQFMRTRKVVMGVDTSEASGGDDIGVVLVDAQTGGVVAAGKINETNLITFAKWLVEMIVEYDNLTLIPERRSSAATIIDYLLLFLPERGIDPFKRIFNWIVSEPHEHAQRYQEAILPMSRRPEDLYVRCKKYFGFATSGGGQTSRADLYSKTLYNAAKRHAEQVHDQELIQQIASLVTKNGRVDHADGEHDDLVIGWLLPHWMLSMGKNLQYYGIDPNRTLVKLFTPSAAKPIEKMEHYEQEQLRHQMEALMTMMREENDPLLIDRFEKQLRALERRLIHREADNFSLDAFLTELDNNRGKKQRAYASQHVQGQTIAEQIGYGVAIDRTRLGANTFVIN